MVGSWPALVECVRAQTHRLSREEAEGSKPPKQCQSSAAAQPWRRAEAGQRGQEEPLKTTAALPWMLCAKFQQKLAWSQASSILRLKLHRDFIFQLFCQEVPRNGKRGTHQIFLCSSSQEIFFTSRIQRKLPSTRYPSARGLAFNCGIEGPSQPVLLLWKRFRCQSVQGCGPVSLS